MKNIARVVLSIGIALLLSSCLPPTGPEASGDAAKEFVPFTPVAEDAFSLSGDFTYIAQSSLGEPVDTLTFTFVDYTPPVGSVVITGDGTSSCTACVLVYVGCDDTLSNCSTTYLAQKGTVIVSSTGGSGDTFSGTLENALFVEVTVDGSNVSTPVAGGNEFVWESFSFNTAIQ